MQNKIYPKYSTHKECKCFHCGNNIGKDELPINYGFPKGKYGIWCENCRLRTYYDTEDKSISFDHIGDPIKPCTLCGFSGHKIERYDGYMVCSNCMGA